MRVVDVAAQGAGDSVAGLLAAERFQDPENARTILLMAGGLVLLAVLVAAGTVWWWRSSRVEHSSLAPLEVMGTRSWWKSDYTVRRRRLDIARSAASLSLGASETPPVETIDLDAMRRGLPPQFDDLVDVPLVHVSGVSASDAADLDALLAAAGASIAGAQQDQVSAAESLPLVEPALSVPEANGAAVAPADAVAERAPMDPLLRPLRGE